MYHNDIHIVKKGKGSNTCGHWGFISKRDSILTGKQREVRRNITMALGYAMEERGDHGTGFAVVRNGKTHIIKQAESAEVFLSSNMAQWHLRGQLDIILGHTRFATVGERTDKNTHPFCKGNIVGAHNGSIYNWKDLDPKATVDSEAIFTTLNKENGDFKKAFKKLDGDQAVSWLDLREPNTLNLVSHHNPIVFCRVPQLQTIFYCSTEPAMRAVMRSALGNNHKDIYEALENTVYSIKPNLEIKKTNVEFMTHVYSGVKINGKTVYDSGNPYSYLYNDPSSDSVPDDIEEGHRSYLTDALTWVGEEGCTECGILHRDLTKQEKLEKILYDFEAYLWVCPRCKHKVGKAHDYRELTWQELINCLIEEAKREDGIQPHTRMTCNQDFD